MRYLIDAAMTGIWIAFIAGLWLVPRYMFIMRDQKRGASRRTAYKPSPLPSAAEQAGLRRWSPRFGRTA